MSSSAICSVLGNLTKKQDPFGNRFILHGDGLQPFLGTRAVKPGAAYSFTSVDPTHGGALEVYFPKGSPFGTEDLIKTTFNYPLTVSREADGDYPFIVRSIGRESTYNLAVAENGVAQGELRLTPDLQWRSCIRIYRHFSKIFFDTRGLPAYKVVVLHARSGRGLAVYPWRRGYFALVPRGTYRIVPEPKLLNETGPDPGARQTGGTWEAELIVEPGILDSRGKPILSRSQLQVAKGNRPRRVQLVFKDTDRVQNRPL